MPHRHPPRRRKPAGPATWGGPRRGAGRRPKGPRAGVPHTSRTPFNGRAPAHVTLRVLPDVWNLRAKRTLRRIRDAFSAANAEGRLRIVHFSVQGNHIHLIVEADGSEALSRGVQGLNVRLARSLNALMQREGTVFADRYHSRVLTTPSQVRNALAYVLNNRRRHQAAGGRPLPSETWIDPCSSAAWFDGWRDRPPDPPPAEAVVVEATVWLLRVGWRRRGLIEVGFVPGVRTAARGA